MRVFTTLLLAAGLAFGQAPADGPGWFGQGVKQHQAGQYDEAITSFQKALDLEFNAPAAMMRIGRAWAKKADSVRALEWMRKAAESGFAQPGAIQADLDTAAVRADARFAPILERIVKNATPCEQSAGFRGFDFWVGEWDVLTAAGGKAESVIEKIAGGCAILESWYAGGKSAGPGTTGKSLNLFNPATGRWRQLWTDDTGHAQDYEGEIRDGAMHYTYQTDKAMGRMTFTPLDGGRVRQLVEQSVDGGTTWSAQFDGTYVSKKPAF